MIDYSQQPVGIIFLFSCVELHQSTAKGILKIYYTKKRKQLNYFDNLKKKKKM